MTTEKQAIDNGGPAFPWPSGHSSKEQQGMRLRDYFAAKAMQGIIAGSHPITKRLGADHVVAVASYKMADAMIEARKGGAA